jgi:hypothetical protein
VKARDILVYNTALTAICAYCRLRNTGNSWNRRIDELRERPMKLTIELGPALKAELVALAKAQGLGLPQYVQRVLKVQIAIQARGMSPAERAAAWLASTDGLPPTPPLSDEAISRESMYGQRG